MAYKICFISYEPRTDPSIIFWEIPISFANGITLQCYLRTCISLSIS